MKDINLFQVIAQVFSLVWPQNSERQANQCPQMHDAVTGAVMLTQFMDLGMAVMASGDAVIRTGRLNLLIFQPTILQARLLIAGLEEPAAAAAAVIVRAVGLHVDEVVFADHGLDDEAQIFGNGVAITLANDLTRILDGELDFQILVPVGIDLQFALANPLGVVFVDVLDLELMRNVVFFQSCQDREGNVPSLGIEKDATPQIVGLLGRCAGDVLPGVVIGQKHTVVLAAPSLGPIGPIGTGQVQDFPQGHHLIRFRDRLA